MNLAKKLCLGVGATLTFFALVEAALALVAALFLRPPERPGPHPGPSDRFHVLVLGDSFSYGIFLEPEESYPEQLRELVRLRSGAEWEITNAAEPGNSPLMILRELDRTLAAAQPDLVLLLAGFNVNDGDIVRYREVTGRGVEGLRGLALRASSELSRFRSYRLLRNGVLRLPRPSPAGGYDSNTKMKLFDFRVYQEVNRWALDSLVAEIRGRGIDLVLLNYPQAPVPPNPADEENEFYYVIFMREVRPLGETDYLVERRPRETAMNAVIGDVARRRGVALVDHFAAFDARPDRGAYFLEEDEHPNARGYALMADNVLASLVTRGLVSAGPE